MRPIITSALASAISLTTSLCLQGQTSEYLRQAQLAEDGTIFVSSDAGRRIKMADPGHCLEVTGAEDQQTIGCSIARGSTKPEEFMQSQRLEIYMRNGRQSVINTDGPIMYWHFWEGGRELAVTFRARDKAERHVLYDASTGNILQETDDPADPSRLPQWAKSAAQLQDESVPEGEEYDRARIAWIAKTLRRVAKIQPGKTRQELTKVFTTEGGLSTRFQRTYVYSECPYIKVNVQFRAVRNEQDGLTESPDDVIVSISRPYLAWSVND